MQKKIIALAIASALTAPVAMADTGGNVGMYGQVNLSADRVSSGAATSTNSNVLANNSSRLGVAGNEDLGGGLTAMFQAEGGVDQAGGTTGSSFAFNRNTFLGLKSADFGTLLAGRHDSAYDMSTRGLDLFADTVAADNRGTAAAMSSGHDVRRENSLNYMSPSMSGFGLNVALAQAQLGQGKSVSVAGTYGMDNMMATLAYDKADKTATASEIKAFKLGGSYAIDAFKLNAIVEKATVASTPESKGTNVYLGGQYSLSATDAVKLAFAKKGNTTGNTDNAKQVTVGYDHGMSKRTSVYALYTKITDSKEVLTVGNPDPSTVSIGMKHAF